MKVILVMAATLDGRIAKTSSHFPDWTSREDKKFFHRVSKESGVVIMGDKTFDTFPQPLKERLSVVFTLDADRPEIPGVKWVKGEPAEALKELESMGYETAILGGGAAVNGMFLEKNLIDEIYVTVEPKIFGDGLALFKGDFDVNLKLKEIEKINDDSVVLKYEVVK